MQLYINQTKNDWIPIWVSFKLVIDCLAKFLIETKLFLSSASPHPAPSQTESPYHDVSGLPDPYNMEQMQMGEDQIDHSKPPQQQHMSLGYDETLESGYSTPNSRNRRVIREIIV